MKLNFKINNKKNITFQQLEDVSKLSHFQLINDRFKGKVEIKSSNINLKFTANLLGFSEGLVGGAMYVLEKKNDISQIKIGVFDIVDSNYHFELTSKGNKIIFSDREGHIIYENDGEEFLKIVKDFYSKINTQIELLFPKIKENIIYLKMRCKQSR